MGVGLAVKFATMGTFGGGAKGEEEVEVGADLEGETVGAGAGEGERMVTPGVSSNSAREEGGGDSIREARKESECGEGTG